MILRAPRADDAERIALLVTELGYPANTEELNERLARIDGVEGVFVRVAEIDGSVVGVATCHSFMSLHKTEPVVARSYSRLP